MGTERLPGGTPRAGRTPDLARLSAGAPLPILMYHSIPDATSGAASADIPAAQLQRQLALLHSEGWHCFGLTDALRERDRSPQRRILALTFDDGYSNVESAADIVHGVGAGCTAFITTNFLGTSSDYVTPSALRRLHDAGVEIGSHGESHAPLDTARSRQISGELVASKRRLEDLTGSEVSSVCYPHGYWSRRVLRLARQAGYKSGCTVGRSVAVDQYVLALPRVQPLASMSDEMFLRMVSHGEPGIGPLAKKMAAPFWRAARFGASTAGLKLT
jgi:peptidoglycan/xylan/chitin deacetylase (PgdA/CDA1 family)